MTEMSVTVQGPAKPRPQCVGRGQRASAITVVFPHAGFGPLHLCIGCGRRMYQTLKHAQDELAEYR